MLNSSKKERQKLSECRICGACAYYAYFGVISCQPCKMFFKRNAEKTNVNLNLLNI